MIWTILFIIWYLIGCASFVYWWTKDDYFRLSTFFLMLFIGVGGIFVNLIGYYIYETEKNLNSWKVI
jgi:Co/Zn/Cd efflux system component